MYVAIDGDMRRVQTEIFLEVRAANLCPAGDAYRELEEATVAAGFGEVLDEAFAPRGQEDPPDEVPEDGADPDRANTPVPFRERDYASAREQLRGGIAEVAPGKRADQRGERLDRVRERAHGLEGLHAPPHAVLGRSLRRGLEGLDAFGGLDVGEEGDGRPGALPRVVVVVQACLRRRGGVFSLQRRDGVRSALDDFRVI